MIDGRKRLPLFALLALVGSCGAEPRSIAPRDDESSDAPLEVGLRRLTVAEYERAASDLLGFDVRVEAELPPDPRQSGFSTNVEASVDSLFATRLDGVANALADRAVREGSPRLSSACKAETPERCARELVTALGTRAFRRPLSDGEVTRYVEVFAAGMLEGDASSGERLLLATLLQSPSMLYLTSLGTPGGSVSPAPSLVDLTSFELASHLAFALTGGPPDDELLAVAEGGGLATDDGIVAQAWRLLRQYPTRFQFQRFVDEWLGLDALSQMAKDATLHASFPALVSTMINEVHDMVDRVMITQGASERALLSGVLEPASRAGILQSPAFLARYAHESESAPILRGVAILRRVLCRTMPSAAELGIDVIFPRFDARVPTRQRYAEHTTDAACSACHAAIDGIGFTFENFDEVGAPRNTDAGRAIDTSGAIELETGKVLLRDSVDLSDELSRAPEAERCLARQVFRFSTGITDESLEEAFVARTRRLPPASRSSVVQLFVEVVTGRGFRERRLR